MNSFGFSKIKDSLDVGDHAYASMILEGIDYDELGCSGRDLYDFFVSKLKGRDRVLSEPSYEDGLLSFHDDKSVIPGISLVSCCMNRNDNLVKSIPTWLQLPVDEIVIVDWSSEVPVAKSLECFDDNRIKIIRVNGEKKWVLTYAFNVGLRFARFSRVFKLDADIQVNGSFVESNYFSRDEFVRGSWEKSLEAGMEDQVFVNGSFGAFKDDLKKIGYYNEYIKTYGWDDSDLYERLSVKAGLKTKFLKVDSLIHIEQKQEDRTVNQSLPDSSFLGKVSVTEFNNSVNKYIARVYDFWESSKLNDYYIKKEGNGYWVADRKTNSVDLPKELVSDAKKYAASLFSWVYADELYSLLNDGQLLTEFLLKEYYSGIPYWKTRSLLGFGNADRSIFVNKLGESYIDFIVRASAQAGDLIFVCDEVPAGNLKINNNVHFVSSEELELVNFFRAENKKDKVEVVCDSEQLTNRAPRFYVDAQHGLGNRLRAIGSAAAIAEATGRELVIVWQPDHHCNCLFSDLFDYRGPVINSSFLDYAKISGMQVYNYMEIEADSKKDEVVSSDVSGDIYARSAYVLQSAFGGWDEDNRFIRFLKPSARVKELIEGFELSGCVGVHVRMEAGKGLDHNSYDDVSNWTKEGHDQIHYWRDKSHYSHFVQRINQLIKENPRVELFLATDLPETYEIFKKCFGERCHYLTRDVFDRSKEQLVYALADIILLSRCEVLLGSTWSSFSECAMRLSSSYSKVEMSGVDF